MTTRGKSCNLYRGSTSLIDLHQQSPRSRPVIDCSELSMLRRTQRACDAKGVRLSVMVPSQWLTGYPRLDETFDVP
jgi:hypothetical protein